MYKHSVFVCWFFTTVIAPFCCLLNSYYQTLLRYCWIKNEISKTAGFFVDAGVTPAVLVQLRVFSGNEGLLKTTRKQSHGCACKELSDKHKLSFNPELMSIWWGISAPSYKCVVTMVWWHITHVLTENTGMHTTLRRKTSSIYYTLRMDGVQCTVQKGRFRMMVL